MRGIIYCVHLSGVGGLKRMLTLAKGLLNDCEVTFVQAGKNEGFNLKHPNFHHINLPHSDDLLLHSKMFNRLQKDPSLLRQFYSALNKYMKTRKKIIFSMLDFSKAYDFIITEQVPISKTIYLNEVYTILSAAKKVNPSLAIISSQKCAPAINYTEIFADVEMIMKSNLYSLKHLKSNYDKILVHADPQINKLEETFLYCDQIRDKIEYTGYITTQAEKYPPSIQRKKIILVSTGSGIKGNALLKVLVKVISQIPEYQFVFVKGPMMTPGNKQLFHEANEENTNVEIVDFLDNFDEKLQQCSLAITLAGSTLINIYLTGTPALVYREISDGGQQTLGKKFADKGIIRLIKKEDLSPDKLKYLILETIKNPPKSDIILNLSGVENTRKAIKQIVTEKRSE
jgi:predicted glycosyltransferase